MSKTNVSTNLNSNVKEVITKQEKTILQKFDEMVKQELTTDKQLEKLVELYNGLQENEKTLTRQNKIENQVISVNKALKGVIVSQYTKYNHAELIKALCNVDVKIDKNDSATVIGNKVKNAIAYDVKRVEFDKNSCTIKSGIKGLLPQDIIQGKASIIASVRANKDVEKADIEKAQKEVLNTVASGIMYCLVNVATMSINRTDKKILANPDFIKIYNALDEIYQQQGKENPFSSISNKKKDVQLKVILSTLFNEDYTKVIECKKYMLMLLDMIVSTNPTTGVQKVTQDILTVLQQIIVVARYMHNGIEPQIQVNKKVNTTK